MLVNYQPDVVDLKSDVLRSAQIILLNRLLYSEEELLKQYENFLSSLMYKIINSTQYRGGALLDDLAGFQEFSKFQPLCCFVRHE